MVGNLPRYANSVLTDAAATSKRHHYYCRSRNQNPAPPRKKACEACVVAKTRCDLNEPCGRCSMRENHCRYPVDTLRPKSGKCSNPISHVTSADVSPTFRAPDSPSQSLPSASNTGTSATFSRRNAEDVKGVAVRDLVLTMLSTIAAMFRDNHTASPLIHHRQLPAATGNPLATCQVLLQQFDRSPDTRHDALWECVQREAERIWFHHETWDDWGLIASMQAMFFYAILRATSTSTPSPGFDLPFLVCMNQVCKCAKHRFEDNQDVNHADPHALGYEGWARYEACKRIATVYRTLNLIIDISDAVSCIAHPGYCIMPLPTQENIWHAQNSAEWQTYLSQGEVYGLTLAGELQLLDKDSDRVPPAWDTWCSTRGHLGSLVATAALLLP